MRARARLSFSLSHKKRTWLPKPRRREVWWRCIAPVALDTSVATVARRNRKSYLPTMNLAEIEQEALALPERERASLAAKLLDTLPPPGTDVSDEEVERRELELESGQATAISHEEFVRRVEQERRR